MVANVSSTMKFEIEKNDGRFFFLNLCSVEKKGREMAKYLVENCLSKQFSEK